MNENRIMTYKEAAAEGLLMAMERDSRVFLMGEGVDNITGVYGHVLPAFEKFGVARVVDTPISENALTGIAIGAALDGMHPVLIHQRNDFMLLAMDQLMNQAAKMNYLSGGRHSVPLTILSFVARKPGEGGQHSQSLQAVFGHFPGIQVCMPATPEDAKGLILTATACENPTIVLEHRSLFEDAGNVPEEYYHTQEAARVVRVGTDITIVAVSAALRDAMRASDELAQKDISCEVIDLRWIRPLDIETIMDSVAKTRRLLVVDTGWRMFGVASEVIASIAERLRDWKCPPQRIGLPDIPCPASQYLEQSYHPDARTIIQNVCIMASSG